MRSSGGSAHHRERQFGAQRGDLGGPSSRSPAPDRGGFAALLGVRSPDRDQWRRLGEGLLIGDAAMDDLVDWMVHTGTAQTRPLFDRALTYGIAAVPEAPEPLRAFFTKIETVPDWVDHETLTRAAKVLLCSGADSLYFLGRRTMRVLGLPTVVVPWYPALRIPTNMVRSATRQLPGGFDRAASRGAWEQNRFMRTLVETGPTIGGLTHAA